MPRFPDLSSPAAAMPSSIFARLVDKLATYQGEIFPLHLGDTHLMPPAASWLSRLSWDEGSVSLSRYGTPAGDARLVEAIVTKLREKNRITAEPKTVQITCGA